MSDSAPAPKPRLRHRPSVWCFSTYFAEGFPFSIFRTLSGFYFRDRGVSLKSIGLTSFYGLPWVLKFLWSPQVDEFATKRRWLLGMEAALAAIILAAALLSPLAGGVQLVALLFLLGSFVAATHDVAIDGYYMAALDKAGQAKFVGYRIMAYRLAMLTGQGVVATVASRLGWLVGFLLAFALFAAVALYHFFFLPEPESQRKSIRQLLHAAVRRRILLVATGAALLILLLREFFRLPAVTTFSRSTPWLRMLDFPNAIALLLLAGLVAVGLLRRRIRAFIVRDPDSFYGRAFLTFMSQPAIGVVLGFVILMRVGEWVLTSMISPFFVDLGLKSHYGWISGGVGLPCAIAGAMAGGWLIARFGLRRVIWPLLLAQNLTNLVYMGLASHMARFVAVNTNNPQPLPVGALNLAAVAAVHGFDQFASGLGNAVLVTVLMRICLPEFKAAHYAIGSGLTSVGSLIAGMSSGFLASWLGYGPFFGISFLLSLPGLVMIAFLPLEAPAPPPR